METEDFVTELTELLEKNEDWLMERVLAYAKRQGYTAYTSTLKEAWRLSISGLSLSLINALQICRGEPPEMGPEEELSQDPVAEFGIIEARRHRARGVSLGMFLGLMKYYRQSYRDLVRESRLPVDVQGRAEMFLRRVFDRIEIGFIIEWSGYKDDQAIRELQVRNRLMTNEKNKYLTIFESIPNPVILLNKDMELDNLNHAAAMLFKADLSPGFQYYGVRGDHLPETKGAIGGERSKEDSIPLSSEGLFSLFFWLRQAVEELYRSSENSSALEKKIRYQAEERIFRVKLSKYLDISNKFEGTVIILEDITSLRRALAEVKTLRGFLPICCHCKNVRDDKGYWRKVESYVQEHSEAAFSHGVCPDCARKYYPDLQIYDE